MKLDKFNLIEEMLRAMPDVRLDYEKIIHRFGNEEPGGHNVFGDVVDPYVLSLLSSDIDQSKSLERVFAFFERMATSDDDYVINVLAITDLERLGDDPIILGIARKYMRENTRRISDDIEKGWGRM